MGRNQQHRIDQIFLRAGSGTTGRRVSGPWCTLTVVAERPEVPAALIHRLDRILAELPETYREDAWVGQRWRVGQATVAHVFGGEDQQFRIVFRAPDSEVMSFEHLGPSHFKAGWGRNVVGVIIDGDTDWDDLREMLIDSYCIQAPATLVSQLDVPPLRS